MSTRASLITAALGLQLVACREYVRADQPPAMLQLLLRASELPPGKPGDPQVEVVYRNSGDGTLWFNARSEVSELAFEVREFDDLEPHEFRCKVKMSLPGARDYVFLEPGRDLVVRRSLHCYLAVSLGRYRVRARFHDRNPESPDVPPGVRFVTGPVESNEVVLDLRR